jgi:DNA-binding NarL/FixJ family response regulator
LEATGARLPRDSTFILTALESPSADSSDVIEARVEQEAPDGHVLGPGAVLWAAAVRCNALGQYEQARAASQRALTHHEEVGFRDWSLAELILAAVRTDRRREAQDALEELSAVTQATATHWSLGIEARSRALLSKGEAADRLYRLAIDHLAQTRVRVALARTHLLYGEWLRTEKKRVDARAQLKTAEEMFAAMKIELFAEQSRRELSAAGWAGRKPLGPPAVRPAPQASRPDDDGRERLTAQQVQIARLALDGLSNPEIGAQLFISPRTVKYHLSKVFTKLGLTSRYELSDALDRE